MANLTQQHSIIENLQTIGVKLNALAETHQRRAEDIQLLAVSKRQPEELIIAAHKAGQICFGENQAQELAQKQQHMPHLDWHFIGHLQSNKSKLVANACTWVHAIDSLKIAQRLATQRSTDLPALNVCLQYNVNNEANKHGLSLQDLAPLAESIESLEGLKLRGLMAIPKASMDVQQQRKNFALVRQAYEALQRSGHQLDTLSMGMSNDIEAAVAEGATIVRVGTAIFGERNNG